MENDRERGLNQRCESRRQSWAGIYYPITEQIQSPWPYVHHDVLARLNRGCEIFRAELGNRSDWLNDVRGNIAQRMRNFANAVDTQLIQNDQRNDTHTRKSDGCYIHHCDSWRAKWERTPIAINKWAELVRLRNKRMDEVLTHLSEDSMRGLERQLRIRQHLQALRLKVRLIPKYLHVLI